MYVFWKGWLILSNTGFYTTAQRIAKLQQPLIFNIFWLEDNNVLILRPKNQNRIPN